jgi:hypothetical protein
VESALLGGLADEVESEVGGGVGAGAGGFAEGDVADVEGAFDGFVAFEEVADGEDLDAGEFVAGGAGGSWRGVEAGFGGFAAHLAGGFGEGDVDEDFGLLALEDADEVADLGDGGWARIEKALLALWRQNDVHHQLSLEFVEILNRFVALGAKAIRSLIYDCPTLQTKLFRSSRLDFFIAAVALLVAHAGPCRVPLQATWAFVVVAKLRGLKTH